NDDELFQLGLSYWDGIENQQHFIKAVQYFQQAADSNHSLAQQYLEQVYDFNNDTQQRYDIYLTTHSDSATTDIQNIAENYIYGNTMNKDFKKAIFWYKKLTNLDYYNALVALGNLYRDGKAVEQSYERAVSLYILAAEHNSSNAQYALGNFYS